MEEIVTILSTREWAITIWGTGFFIWMLTQSEIRKSLWNVIKILLGKNLRRFATRAATKSNVLKLKPPIFIFS